MRLESTNLRLSKKDRVTIAKQATPTRMLMPYFLISITIRTAKSSHKQRLRQE